MVFLPHTQEERQDMLDALGLKSEDELFHMIPDSLKTAKIEFPPALKEMEVAALMEDAAAKNHGAACASFIGAGAYSHFIPQAVSAVISRGDFSTAYTPYQPEVSQGTLQGIFEFQTMLSRLTGVDACNAGVYDGASALAEGALMACRATRKEKILVSETVNPHYRRVLKTYLGAPGIACVEIPASGGVTDLKALEDELSDDVAAFFVQHPNYFGILEPVNALKDLFEGRKTILGASVYPHSLGLLNPPGSWGAGIVTGELQSLGIPLSYGGPYSGFVACVKNYVRQIPGRLVGHTKDLDGKSGYVLTLQTREQHIRRNKATSNICTNQALCTLAATVYLALMGPKGLQDAAGQSVRQAHRLQQALCAIEGVELLHDKPFFNEFALKLPVAAQLFIDYAAERNILAGVPLDGAEGNALLVCATEITRDADIERFAGVAADAVKHAQTAAV